MAAANALHVVKQIEALADGPASPDMKACLGQVVSSLLFFLDHPDSRVRLSSARALLKLATGYRQDAAALDMSRARSALARCRAAKEDGTGDADSQELAGLLAEMLEEAPEAAPANSAGTSACSSSAVPPPTPAEPLECASQPQHAEEDGGREARSGVDGRGEVVLKLSEHADAKVKAAILEKVVALAGVVSVTFEGVFIIVSTRTPAIASDAGFLVDVLAAVKAQGLEGVSLITAAAAGSGGSRGASLGDVQAGPASTDVAAGLDLVAAETGQPAEASDAQTAARDDEPNEEAEPAYLDDDEDELVVTSASVSGGRVGGDFAGGPLAGGANWSFFSQTNWMTGRKMQEFDDDPSIAARLAKAKQRDETRRHEERSRLGGVMSWLTGSG